MLPEATRAPMWFSKILPVSEGWREAGSGEHLEDLDPRRGKPGVEPAPERRVGRERHEEWHVPGERIDGQDRSIPVGDGDVDVKTVDSLRPRYPAHLLFDAPVVIPTRERLLCRLGERMGARRHDLDPTTAREVAHLPAQPR